MTDKGAARIHKGDLPALCLSESEIIRLIDPAELIDGLEKGFVALSAGQVQSPERPEITLPGKGFSLAMSAWMPGMNITVKVVNVFESNLASGLPNHLASITLYDPDNGKLLCVMDGTFITAIRTAASAIMSAKLLARDDARIATVIGAGVQGRQHLRLLPLIGDFDEIRIASLHYDDAENLASEYPEVTPVRDIEQAVRSSDIVCLASHSYAPIIQSDWVRDGSHVSSVGYAPPAGELPVALATKNSLFVESFDAFKAPPVGCGELHGLEEHGAVAIGDVLSGAKQGRVSNSQITVYKAMGLAMEDMVAADIAYKNAMRSAEGQTVAF